MSKETGPTGPTLPTASVEERLESLLEAIATANRAARVHAEEMRRLRFAITFALIVIGMAYITRGKVS